MFIVAAVGDNGAKFCNGLTPVLNESLGFRNTMAVFAGISIALTALFYVLGKENNLTKSKAVAMSAMSEIKLLLTNKNLVILLIVCFFALGVFNGLTTWLEPILKPNNVNAEEAGLIGAFMIVGGIVGSIIIPTLSDKLRVRKPFLALCCLAAMITIYPLCTMSSLNTLYLLGGVLGFFFLPGYALLLSMCEEMAGIEKAGAATGLLMMAGNAGAVVVIALMPIIIGESTLWTNAIYLMLALISIALVFIIGFLKESFVKSDL